MLKVNFENGDIVTFNHIGEVQGYAVKNNTTVESYSNLDIKWIAKEIREELKTKYPTAKFAVRIERYAGGQSLYVSLLSWDKQVFERNPGYIQLNQYAWNHYCETDEEWSRGRPAWDNPADRVVLTKEVVELWKEVDTICNRRNWNNSDSRIDYFDVNFYWHPEIGRFNKEFEQK